MNKWIILIIIGISAIFIFSMSFIIIFTLFQNKRINKPMKETIIIKLDLFNRKFFVEQIGIKDKRLLKYIDLKKWNKLSIITSNFNQQFSMKLTEVLNDLDNGSEYEYFYFEDQSIYTKRKRARYFFTFSKIDDSTDYLVEIKFNHILDPKKDKVKNQIIKIEKNKIMNIKQPIKGFIAFNIVKKTNEKILKFVSLLKINNKKGNIYYLNHDSFLIILIANLKRKQVEKSILKIKNNVLNTKFSSEIRYLYKGSSVAISSKANSVKRVNQILQTLNFLTIDSKKRNEEFLLLDENFNKNKFKTYNQALKIFNNSLKDKKFQIVVSSVRNIGNNNRMVDYVFPKIKNINENLFNWIISDLACKKDLTNAFAEKILIKTSRKPIMLDVNDGWIIDNLDRIKNKRALMVIKFNKINKTNEKINFIKSIHARELLVAFTISDYNENIVSILRKTKPRFILVDDIIWTSDKLLISNYFMKLMSLNDLTKKYKIKILYKNPSLILDKKTYRDIGLKYYFQK